MRAYRIPRPSSVSRQSYHHCRRLGHPILSLLQPQTFTPTTSTTFRPLSASFFRQYGSSLEAKPMGNSSAPLTTPIATTLKGKPLDRVILDVMLRQLMFYTPSFEIYSNLAGFYDYGPSGCALQNAVLDVWRKHFIVEEDMLEVDSSVLTPYDCLKTSGHTARFADAICKDPINGDVFRADHFIEEILKNRLEADRRARNGDDPSSKDMPKIKGGIKIAPLEDAVIREYEETLAKLDTCSTAELGGLIQKYDLRNPATSTQPKPPTDFNLMFNTSVGPLRQIRSLLRPETAQGQFVNFKKLLDFNYSQMPFASASIGKSYRNEIAPRSGLLRVREFLMAEIEHFVDPEEGKKHPRFVDVKDVQLALWDRETQLSGETTVQKVTIGQAVANGTVDNETLGYFLARIQLFFDKIGIDQSKIRFRQQTTKEMAHYATDCWDAELLTSYGWIECVGCADRGSYDLDAHIKATGAPLMARKRLEQPIEETQWQIKLDMKKFSLHFRKQTKAVATALEATTQHEREEFSKSLDATGSFDIEVASIGDSKVSILADFVTVEQQTKIKNEREFVPHVIEPSFGIGRILYALMEHCFWIREDGSEDRRKVLSFPPTVAPTLVSIGPIVNTNDALQPVCQDISRKLRHIGVSNRINSSSHSVGKRYVRSDELGIPLFIVVDSQTIDDKTLTLRDRDSTKQVRAEEDVILAAVRSIKDGSKTWQDIEAELPAFNQHDKEGQSSASSMSETVT